MNSFKNIKKSHSQDAGRSVRPTHVLPRVRLIFAMIPNEGSTLPYMDDMTPTTTMNQLEGLAGNTPVMMPF